LLFTDNVTPKFSAMMSAALEKYRVNGTL